MAGKKTAVVAKADMKKPRKTALSKTLNPRLSKKTNPKGKKKKGEMEERRRRPGPRLPSALRKELDHLNGKESDSESDGIKDDDLYEYEEAAPEEESRKNRRFDSVENYEYELPEDFEDEDVPSDDEEDDDIPSDASKDGQEGDKHLRMLEGITGLPGQAFEGKERKKFVISDFQGESTDGRISIHDLLDPLHGKPGYSNLRKRLEQLERKPMTVQAPLSKVEREKLERKVAYQHSKKDITNWEPLVKRNREAPTLYFDEDVNLGYSTVGAIAAEFKPRTEFEKKMALLVCDPEVVEAHKNDGARLLEFNKISINDVKERQNRLAKMRSLLFRHELKAKHIKKIKSKTYHRVLKKEKMKAASAEVEMDPEAVKENAMKQEFKRAEERMTLKHKNRSKWAKRILKRGLTIQDEGTRAALTEQLHQHALLTRKMNSIKDTSSSDETSDEDDDSIDDELSPGMEKERAAKLINKAKENTLKALEDGDELPKSGVFALPFMERGLKKRQEAAEEEARIAMQEYDASLRQLENEDDVQSPKSAKESGRKVFGPTKDKPQQSRKKMKSSNVDSSDSEDDFEDDDHANNEQEVKNQLHEFHVGPAFHDDSENTDRSVFKSFDDIMKEPGPRTTCDVAIFVSDSWKKMKGENTVGGGNMKCAEALNSQKLGQGTMPEDVDQDSDDDAEERMVDGFLSSSPNHDYELPSQTDLIHDAFAGDDVEAEFEKDKMEILNEENPEPEKPVVLPGWGQWTHVQQKKGTPSWMLKEHENAKRKREEALQKRKDANLKHVIISEKIDKKSEKLLAKSLPFPHTSKEVYEQSIRMPIGPEYNPALTAGALNRPTIVKKAGVIIKPIQYEEVDPHEKQDEPKRIVHKETTKRKSAQKEKSRGGKHAKKRSTKRSS